MTSNYIYPSPNSLKYKSYRDFLQFQNLEAEKKRRKDYLEEEDKSIERSLKKRQLWLAKYWWFTSGVSLIAGVLIQKILKIL
jgi:hypothetical protein